MTTLETILIVALLFAVFVAVEINFARLDNRDYATELRKLLDMRPSIDEVTDPSSSRFLGDNYFRYGGRYLDDDNDYAIFLIAKAAIEYDKEQKVAKLEDEARDEFLRTSEWDLSAYTGILEKSGVDEATFLRLAPKIF